MHSLQLNDYRAAPLLRTYSLDDWTTKDELLEQILSPQAVQICKETPLNLGLDGQTSHNYAAALYVCHLSI